MYTLLYLADSKPVEVCAMLVATRWRWRVRTRLTFCFVSPMARSARWSPAGRTTCAEAVGASRSSASAASSLAGRRASLSLADFEPATLKLPEVNAFIAEIVDFITCLRERRPPLQSEVHGIDVVKVILAAYRSQDEKRVIELDAEGWSSSVDPFALPPALIRGQISAPPEPREMGASSRPRSDVCGADNIHTPETHRNRGVEGP